MRVHGKGAGFSGERDFRRNQGVRIEQFRRERRVGEEVRGKMLGFEAPGLARVLIEGREMLARVGSNPSPGQIMIFLVVSLRPEIVLKELPAQGRTQRDMAPLANALSSRRAALEAILGDAPALPDDLPDDLFERKARFFARLETMPEALELYRELKSLCDEANAFLAPAGRGRFHYLPWVLPGTAGQEALIRRTRPASGKNTNQTGESPVLWDIRFYFESRETGRCEVRILYARPRARYRLFLDHPEAAATLIPRLEGLRLGHVAIEQERLGIAPFPSSSTGLLAGALSRTRQGFTGINLQV